MNYKPAHILEYAVLISLAALVRMLPLRAALALGWLVAATTHFIGRIHVARTRKRVRQVLGPEATDKQVRRVAWLSWRNLCFNAIEGFRFSKLTAEKIRKMPMAHLEPALHRIVDTCENGFILATPHMGNWEIAGIAGDLLGFPLFTIVRKQKNPLINDYINKMRRAFNLELLYRENKSWKGVTDRIKQGKILAILPDINSRRKGVTVDYLNGKATIAPGAALFAQLAHCPVVPIIVRRIGWTQHDAVLFDPIFPDPNADREADQQRIMQEIMSAFTQEILKTPEDYFWHNKRWVLNKP
jgi:KDO2-lipid IV(A) lauroyltransferase